MGLSKTKQFKKHKVKQKELEDSYMNMVRDKLEHKFFNDNVPKWRQWLMVKFSFFRNKWKYDIGLIDGDLNRMVLTLNRKVIAKTFE